MTTPMWTRRRDSGAEVSDSVVRLTRITSSVEDDVSNFGELMGVMLLCGASGCVEQIPLPAAPRIEQGRESWRCGFPAAATDAEVKDATVVLRVLVKTSGAPSDVQILSATSPLFIEHTRQCALAHYYEPARDADELLVEGWTEPFKVHYVP